MHHTETDLRDLEEMLLSLPAENDGMLLSEFDGFCAALVAGPEPIPPSDWLPLVWGDEATPSFARHEDVQSAVALLMAHYNRVARSLMPPSAGYEAIYDSDPINGDTLWEPWVAGFEQAMALRRESWVAIVEGGDPEAAAAVNTMLALHQIDAGTSDLDADSIDALDEAAPDLIPRLVETINAWTKARSSPSRRATIANTNARPAGNRKIGRNDPCPCGSGKKYKKCCGD